MANTLIKNTVAPGTGGSGGGGAGGGGGGGGSLPPIGSPCRAAVDAAIAGLFPGGIASAGSGRGGNNGVSIGMPDGSNWVIDGASCENGYVSFDYKSGIDSVRSSQ